MKKDRPYSFRQKRPEQTAARKRNAAREDDVQADDASDDTSRRNRLVNAFLFLPSAPANFAFVRSLELPVEVEGYRYMARIEGVRFDSPDRVNQPIMVHLEYTAIPQSLTKSRDGLVLTAGHGSGNAECVMRQQMAMRIYDIGGKRVNEVKLTVKCGDDKVGHCMINLADEQGLSQFKESPDSWLL